MPKLSITSKIIAVGFKVLGIILDTEKGMTASSLFRRDAQVKRVYKL
jgi:hypothetical protein